MKAKDGGPAFPVEALGVTGLSLRDYFAAKSLPLAWRMKPPHGWTLNAVAQLAYAFADAMLAEREKKR